MASIDRPLYAFERSSDPTTDRNYEDPEMSVGTAPVNHSNRLDDPQHYLAGNGYAKNSPLDPPFDGAEFNPSTNVKQLDGLRGIACLIVFNQHYTYVYTDKTALGWGVDPDKRWLPLLPFLRTFWCGGAMVTIFLIISGYVLSTKAVRVMNCGNREQALEMLSSGILRRWFRLFVPIIVSTFLWMLVISTGLLEYSRQLREDRSLIAAGASIPNRENTLAKQFVHWWQSVLTMTTWWWWDEVEPAYNPHLWTIGLEFRASMMLMLLLVATARLKSSIRILSAVWMTVYCIYFSKVYYALFFVGMIIAEVDVHLARLRSSTRRTSSQYSEDSLRHQLMQCLLEPGSRPYRVFHYCLLVIGLYLVGYPSQYGYKTPGYALITRMLTLPGLNDPYGTFIPSIGATLIVICVIHLNDVAWLFLRPVPIYLGKISYSLYIVHGEVLQLVSFPLATWLDRSLSPFGGKATVLGLVSEWTFGLMVTLPLTLWAAHLFHRAVDEPFVRLVRRMERKCRET